MPKMRVRGIVLGSNIIRLDCPIPLSEGAAVEVVVDVHSSDNTNSPPRTGSLDMLLLSLEQIRAELMATGHEPPSAEEVRRRIEVERRSWEDNPSARG
jgi:hypothetical protein